MIRREVNENKTFTQETDRKFNYIYGFEYILSHF